jgi:hypothetical protein
LEAFDSGGSSVSEGSAALEDAVEVAIVVGTLMVIFQASSAPIPINIIDVDSSPLVPFQCKNYSMCKCDVDREG